MMPKYIDADALLSEAKRLSGPQTGDGWSNWGVYALIERQPAVELEGKRMEGVWIEQSELPKDRGNKIYRCSICGYTDEHSPTTEVPYCWHCGSKMKQRSYEPKVEDSSSFIPVPLYSTTAPN
jgi:ribosomal protein L37AE/L43A